MRPIAMRNKSKTVATWLAFVGGPFGLHRFYLRGLGDLWGWLLPIPTALGVWGFDRALTLGQDDRLSWLLVPLLGFTVAGCALNAIVFGLMSPEQWNRRYNPQAEPDAPPGRTQWATVIGIAASLLVGAAVLMASIVYSFQRYFEVQVEAARAISQQR